MAKSKTQDYVPTTHAALELGVSANTLYRWSNYQGFPDDAVKRLKGANQYNVAAIRKWLETKKAVYRFVA